MRRLGSVIVLSALTLGVACGGAQNGGDGRDGDPLDSVTGEQLYERGMALARGGDFIRAEQYLAASMERGFPEDRAIPALMHVCVQADRLVAALAYAEPYLEQHPERWSLRMLVASIHMALQHDDRARNLFERVIEDAPEGAPQAHYFLGVLHRDRLDDVETARDHFRRYLALAPEGEHRQEALASLDPAERGLPRRVPMAAEAGEAGEATAGEEDGDGEASEPEPAPTPAVDP